MSHDRFVLAPIHHLMAMVSHVRARPWLAAQTDLTRLSPKLPAASGIQSWIAVGALAVDKPTLRAEGQQRSGVGRCPGWERKWERVLLRSALPCFKPLPHAPS